MLLKINNPQAHTIINQPNNSNIFPQAESSMTTPVSTNDQYVQAGGALPIRPTRVQPEQPELAQGQFRFFNVICQVEERHKGRATRLIQRMLEALQRDPNNPAAREVLAFNSAIDELRGLLPQGQRLEIQFLFRRGVASNLTGADLRGIDLSNCILSVEGENQMISFNNINFSSSFFSNTRISDCLHFEGSNFTSANFRRADLRNMDFCPMLAFGANGGVRSAPNFQGANFEFADLRGATFCNGDLGGTNLQRANFSGADIRGTNFDLANLQAANFLAARTGSHIIELFNNRGVRTSIRRVTTSFDRANLTGVTSLIRR